MQEEKGTTEVEMVGWHHRLNGHEFGQAPGVGDGQGGVVCYSPWGHKKSDMTERLSTAHTADAESPSRWKKLTVCCPQAGNPRMVGIRRLTIKTPPNSHLDTSPPANEKDIKEQIIHPVTRSLTLLLKTLS